MPDPFAAIDVAGAPRALIALGGTLDPATLTSAYRHGCFPWPSSGPDERSLERQARRLVRSGQVPLLPGDDGLVPWCSPDPRAVLLADRVVVSRSLRRTLRRSGWTTTVDAAFARVLGGCADRGREGTWITERMQEAYAALHRAGGAHSVEVWDGERLVGGLYGVLTGRVFSGESMFHLEPDASKVALVDLCDRLLEAGVVLVDTQQATEHMASLGQVVVHREEYLEVLARLRDEKVALGTERRPVDRLA
ncbi:MAG: leucyl/phenylalanyl-tRNA--protein transferase [Actinobacteria bacterium]|nr:leucyl/phenylalanyl-tRNA--protein transferase [Actinomycetota bacterium]MCA1722408.1 leucyl/phenylalanyl-tRNA--protein transferase [Actinomycetota bacterium]